MRARRIKEILAVLTIAGVIGIVLRLVQGLGATTALSDGMPWGAWKIINMVAGVALATGGFAFAFLVHVLGMRALRPLLRPALLVALLGYGASCFALLLDIGLPHRIWHPLLFWNEHSFLFEVAWCVMLYFGVTVLEVSPIALEGSRFSRVLGLLKKVSRPAVILGITLSMLHHSTLGSLFLVAPTRLHPLWYTPWLPLHFILSALGAGLMAIVLLTLTVAAIYRKTAPVPMLSRIAIGASVVLALHLIVKVADVAARGRLGLLASGQWEAFTFMAEVLFAGLIPIVLVAIPRSRRSPLGLATASGFAVAGLLLYRLDVGILGFLRSSGVDYIPSLTELAVMVGILAGAGLLFMLFAERFHVFAFSADGSPRRLVSSDRAVTALRVRRVGYAAGGLVMACLLLAGSSGLGAEETLPSRSAPEGIVLIDLAHDGHAVPFNHGPHVDRLGGNDSCRHCHHLCRDSETATACACCHLEEAGLKDIFDHDRHIDREAHGSMDARTRTKACLVCHDPTIDDDDPFAEPRACAECHRPDDLQPAEETASDGPVCFRDAVHQRCRSCHEKEGLDHCGLCHH